MRFLQIFITGFACKVPINSGGLTLRRDVVLWEHDEAPEIINKLLFENSEIYYHI